MKIAACEVRPDEKASFARWAREYHAEIAEYSEVPSLANTDLVDGCEGVTMLGQGKIDRELLTEYKKLGVKCISTRTIGSDHIDLNAAKELGIHVCNANYAPDGVADFTIMMILMCLRQYKQAFWRGYVNDFSLAGLQGRNLRAMTVGVMGTGRIGQQVIRDLRGFGCRILAYDVCQNAEVTEMAEYVDLDTLLEEMQKRGGDAVLYEKGFSVDAESLDEAELERAIAAAKAADKVVLCMGLPESYETEGLDRKHLNLPGAQLEMIRVLKQYNPNLIVVLNNGAPVVMPFEDDVKAIVEGYLLGQAGSGAMASILYGEVNPSGKLAETFPMRLEDTPAYLNFPGEGYQVEYREGVFVGYRHYDSKKIRPQFAFGEGLSYTTFSYDNIETDQESILDTDQLRVKVRVTNTGKRAGKETVQLYVHDCQNEIIRPEKELKGFVKLSLEPGETKTAEFVLNKRSFAYYDVEQKDFLVQSGQFEILVGASSRDIRLKKTVTVTSTAKIHKHFHANTTFGELYAYLPTRPIAEERMDYFKRESGIDFEMGENAEDFAFRVICDFPLKTLVTFTEGRYSRKQLAELLEQVNKIGEG